MYKRIALIYMYKHLCVIFSIIVKIEVCQVYLCDISLKVIVLIIILIIDGIEKIAFIA